VREALKAVQKDETLWLQVRRIMAKPTKKTKNQQQRRPERNTATATTHNSPGQICVSPAEKTAKQNLLMEVSVHSTFLVLPMFGLPTGLVHAGSGRVETKKIISTRTIGNIRIGGQPANQE
jgi:hypothetical protein